MSALTWVLVSLAFALAGSVDGSSAVRTRRVATPTLALDLAAAALRSGQPLAAALQLAAPAADPVTASSLTRVGRLLQLGADPDEAWRAAASVAELNSLASAARRSAQSGVRLADAFERAAVEIRRTAKANAEARAARVGVWAIAPLGLCFLPAFVCLGIVPVIAGLVTNAGL